jgi:hypothetical protein
MYQIVCHFLWQFCIVLDRCHAMIRGRSNIPFNLELFFLSFERFSETRPTFFCHPSSSRNHVFMHMWGGDDAQEGLAKVSIQDFPRCTGATSQ